MSNIMDSYCIGGETDYNRMFDQYIHKGGAPGGFDLSLSVPETAAGHNSYMSEQQNNYASFENPTSCGETYQDLHPMTSTPAGMPSHDSTVVHTSPQQMPPHPQQQAMYQMGVAGGGIHVTNPQFPPQNMYIPPISQHGSHMAAQTTGYVGQPAIQHASPVYTSAGLALPPQLSAPPGMMATAGGMIPSGYYNPRPPMVRSGGSPTSVGSPSPGSDDSDDSGQIGRGKRPSPEVLPDIAPAKGKKARVSKKGKKKKDPNEPQKPVSAYALFFRDTQSSIKGQNPNATFGEVSKIVASMWDSLDPDCKGVYKKKTEAAKKEYLKQLAAYRATLVSKGEGDSMYTAGGQTFNQFAGTPNYTFPPTTSPGAMPPHSQGHSPPQLSPLAKKTPLLSSLMTGEAGGPPPNQQPLMNPPMSQPMPPTASQMMGHPPHPAAMNPTGMGPTQGQPGPPGPQVPHQPQPVASPQGHLTQMANVAPPNSPFMTQANLSLGSPVSTVACDTTHPMHKSTQPQQQQQQLPPQQSPNQPPPQDSTQNRNVHPNPLQRQQGSNSGLGNYNNVGSCVRSGCPNAAIQNPEWEDEYCSDECVVSHCRDVFNSFVASNQTNSPTYPAPVK